MQCVMKTADGTKFQFNTTTNITNYTLRLKKRIPNILSYNSSKNCLISIIFGTYINKILSRQKIVYFPTSLI